MVSPELFNAAAKGEIATVQNWLVEGGDPNQAIEQAIHHDGSSYDPGSTLVMAAASRARLEVLRRLVEAGADVNVICTGGFSALSWAALGAIDSPDCIEYLLAHGANISGIVDGTRINLDASSALKLCYPRIVRMLLVACERAGVVLTTARLEWINSTGYNVNIKPTTLEELAKEFAPYYRDEALPRNLLRANDCAEVASILEKTRLAGHSYKRWVLKDYMALLRVRSLLSRGRARHGPETTVVAARLFDTSTAAGVPKECFWRVVEYAWLGDWRHP